MKECKNWKNCSAFTSTVKFWLCFQRIFEKVHGYGFEIFACLSLMDFSLEKRVFHFRTTKKSQVQFQPERFESKHMNILSSLKITNVLALIYVI